MKKVCILSYITDNLLDGSFVDSLDLYYNLRNYIDVTYYIQIIPQNITSFLKKIKNTYTQEVYDDIIKHIRLYNYSIDYNLYNLFLYRYNYYLLNPEIAKYNGILINSWTATKELIYNKNNIFSKFSHILTTPFILNYDKSKRYFIYYHKLSEYRLDNMIHKQCTRDTFSNYHKYAKLKTMDGFDIHKYKKLNYARHLPDESIFYMEMKGKLIFEFLYFGKQVHYSPVNKAFDDGLTDRTRPKY